MSQTAMTIAFAKAGHSTPRDRINELVRGAIDRHGGNAPAVVADLSRALLRGDAALIWEFFRHDREARLWREVEDMIRQMRQERGLDAPAPKPPIKIREGHHTSATSTANPATPSEPAGSGHAQCAANGQATPAAPVPHTPQARLKIAEDSLLYGPDAVKIAGVPIGKCSAGVVRSWSRARGRESRFAWLLCEGLTDDMIIGEKKTEADAEEAARLARESNNG
jgi:hypothetical protein